MNLSTQSRLRQIAIVLAAPLLLTLTGCGAASSSAVSDEATAQSVSKYEQAIAANKAAAPKKPAKPR